jgi:DNA-binding response OmpR family regulator
MCQLLIVEDDEICLHWLQAFFMPRAGIKVTITDSAEAALVILKLRRFDLILTDIGLPGRSGLAFAQHVRQRMRITVPIVAITGHGGEVMRDLCLQAGIDHVLEKPVKHQALQVLLDTYRLTELVNVA